MIAPCIGRRDEEDAEQIQAVRARGDDDNQRCVHVRMRHMLLPLLCVLRVCAVSFDDVVAGGEA